MSENVNLTLRRPSFSQSCYVDQSLAVLHTNTLAWQHAPAQAGNISKVSGVQCSAQTVMTLHFSLWKEIQISVGTGGGRG